MISFERCQNEARLLLCALCVIAGLSGRLESQTLSVFVVIAITAVVTADQEDDSPVIHILPPQMLRRGPVGSTRHPFDSRSGVGIHGIV